MSRYSLNGRPVELEVYSRHGENFVNCGNYADGDERELTEDECDEAARQNDGQIAEDMLGRAIDFAHDYMRDR